MPSTPGISSVNRLLAALPDGDRQRMLASCEAVDLVFADVISAPGERISCVHFPTASFVSLVMPIGDAACVEVGMVGNEGMLGAPLALGLDVSPLRAVVQGAGPALRMSGARFRRELARNPALRRAIDRYILVQMHQFAQTAACNRYHLVEARLARLLLMTQDRAHESSFHVTQEFLAYMLGVRRVGVSKAAGSLQKRGLIVYNRGDIKVLDRRGLKGASCGCYAADRHAYDSVLGKAAAMAAAPA